MSDRGYHPEVLVGTGGIDIEGSGQVFIDGSGAGGGAFFNRLDIDALTNVVFPAFAPLLSLSFTLPTARAMLLRGSASLIALNDAFTANDIFAVVRLVLDGVPLDYGVVGSAEGIVQNQIIAGAIAIEGKSTLTAGAHVLALEWSVNVATVTGLVGVTVQRDPRRFRRKKSGSSGLASPTFTELVRALARGRRYARSLIAPREEAQ